MPIQIIATRMPDILIIEPEVFDDERGFFFESFNQKEFNQVLGQEITFVQDNHSRSKKGVLRGLHYQLQHTQGKLVRVTQGAVFDVVVDLRKTSKTFGQWLGMELSAENNKQLWIPPGFAHGFLVLTDEAEFLYKTTDYWDSSSEHTLAWNDPTLNIYWPNIGLTPILNAKDKNGSSWDDAAKF